MLVWRKGNINRTVSVLDHYNGAQWCGQFLEVGRLDWALILLNLALYSVYFEHLCIFSLHGAIYISFFVTSPFSELSVGLVIDLQWLTNHCCSVL